MFDWFNGKDSAASGGPDFSSVDSLQKPIELCKVGTLKKLLLMPAEFGGQDIPSNVVYVPEFVVEQKERIDANIVNELASTGKVTRYQASPVYEGKSFIPSAINVVASDPGSFTATVAIWGKALIESGN